MLLPPREPARDAQYRDRTAMLFYAAAIAFPGVLSLAIKRKLLTDEGGGYDLVASTLGLGDGSDLGVLQRASLYRWDILLALVAVPVLWICIMRALPRRARALLTLAVGVIASLLLFIELKCYWEVGTFLPAHVLASGAMGAGRKFAGEYLRHASVAKLAVLLASVVAASVAGWWFDRGARGRDVALPAWRPTVLTLVALGFVTALPVVPATPFDRSAGVMALGQLVGAGAEQAELEHGAPLGNRDLLAGYRDVSYAPVPNPPSSLFGRFRGYNVLVYLYETLPAACYRAAAGTPDDPYRTLRSLEQSAIVAEHHYATYPYSRRAYFSIYSGWYPPHGMRDFTEEPWDDVNDLAAPGMVRSARLSGYATAAFVPEHPDEWEGDVVRYRTLGFGRHVVPGNAGATTDALRGAPEERVAWQRPQDDSARAMLRREIAKASAAGTPWFFAFNPQLSHGPWPGAATATTTAEICARGAPVFREVDQGLRQVLETLEALGQRDRTIVVALGDHGLRTRAEFPAFRGATLDEITFHVPMVIAVPGLDRSLRLPWTTSHVDIAPSVLDLLGIREARELEQGSPMWDPRLDQRRVFVFAQGYLGVDGWVGRRRAVMLNYLLNGVAETPRRALAFNARQLLETPDSTAREVAGVLRQFTSLQQAFLQRLPGFESMGAAVAREATGDVRLDPSAPEPR